MIRSLCLIFTVFVLIPVKTFGFQKSLGGTQLTPEEMNTFLVNPGISPEILTVNERESLKSGDNLTLNDDLLNGSFNLTVFLKLNQEAAHIWEALQNCYSNVPNLDRRMNLLREDFFKKNLKCYNRPVSELYSSLNNLYKNVMTWLSSDIVDLSLLSQKYVELSEVIINLFIEENPYSNLPPFNPLLGEVLVETLAHLRVQLARVFVKNKAQWRTDKLDLENALMGENQDTRYVGIKCGHFFEISEEKDHCQSTLPLLVLFYKIQKVLKSNKMYCQNYGLWPNATFYLYTGMSPTTVPSPAHPMVLVENSLYEFIPKDYLTRSIFSFSAYHSEDFQSQLMPGCWQNSRDLIRDFYMIPDRPASPRVYRAYSDLFDFYSTSSKEAIQVYQVTSDSQDAYRSSESERKDSTWGGFELFNGIGITNH